MNSVSLKKEQKKLERKRMLKKIVMNKYIYLMLIPVILWYIIFAYIPMYGLSLAFKTFKPGGIYNYLFGGEFVGLTYFKQVLSDPLFYRALKNTLIIGIMNIGILFPFVVILSLILNEIRSSTFKKITQTIMYIPHFFSWVVIGGIVIQLLTINGGAIAQLLSVFNGGEPVSLLTEPKYFRWVLLVSSGFKEMGWDTIIYLSALSGISADLYEAADIDGATRVQKMTRITFPCILPTVMTMLLIKISFIISGNFDQVYMLYNPSVYEVADIIETYLFRTGLSDGRFGMATAMGLFKGAIGIVMLVSCNKLSKKLTGNGVW